MHKYDMFGRKSEHGIYCEELKGLHWQTDDGRIWCCRNTLGKEVKP